MSSSSHVWRVRSAFIFAAVVGIALFSAPVQAQQCGPMDVTFIVDNSGSMGGVITEIQTQVVKIADAVEKASGGDFQFGLIAMPANDVTVLLDMTTGNRTAFDDAVKKMSTSGSSGLGIAYDEALDTVLNHLGPRTGSAGSQTGEFKGVWRPQAVKIIMVITDTGPQGFDSSLGNHGQHAHQMAVQASSMSIHITGIFVPTGGGTDPAVDKPIMQDMVVTSGGLFKETKADASDLSDVIVDIIAACGGATGLGNSNTALVVDPTELFLSTGESADVIVTNFLPAGQGEVTTFSAEGLPPDSTIAFFPRTPDPEGTEARTMHITIGPDTPGGTFLVTVKASREGMADQFNFVLVFVDCVPPFILGTNQPKLRRVPFGSTTNLIIVPNGNAPFKYQWYRGPSGSTAFPIAGATKAGFTTPAINSTSEFWVRVTNACGSRDSATAVVSPN